MALSAWSPSRFLERAFRWRDNPLTAAAGLSIMALALFLTADLLSDSYEEEEFQTILLYFWAATIILLVMAGNTLIYNRLSRALPWTGKRPVTNFYAQLLASLIYSVFVIDGSYFVFKVVLLEQRAPAALEYVKPTYWGMLFLLPVISINFGVYFLRQWKKALIETERLKREQVKSELASLREHVDPHFLFNNLNILSSLIDGERQTAKAFLESLADVYRYVLTSKKSEVVELCEEMEFIQAYVFLIKKRYGEHLETRIEIDERLCRRSVPPLAVQMLVENVIKHNVVSARKPLTLEILSEGETLLVRNNLQPRRDAKSTGTGLDNIARRYEYLSEETPTFERGETHFTARLPLLDI